MESFLMTGGSSAVTADTGPGPKVLLNVHRNSDTDYFGYYGPLTAEEGKKLLSGNDLRAFLGAGVVFNSDMTWHKFMNNGKTLFLTLGGPVRKISYQALYNKNYVMPTGYNVSNVGYNYKLRLLDMNGQADYFSSPYFRVDSEFARLIMPLLSGVGSPATDGEKWGSTRLSFWAPTLPQEAYFFGAEPYEPYAMAWSMTYPGNSGATVQKQIVQDWFNWLPVLELVI